MPEHDAGQCFHLDVFERGLLDFGETPDLGLGEFDVVDRLGRQPFDRSLDLLPGEPEIAWRPVVELLRELAHGGVAAGIDVREHLFDGCPDAFIARGGRVGIDTGFDNLDHVRVRTRWVDIQCTSNANDAQPQALPPGEREGVTPRKIKAARGWPSQEKAARGSDPSHGRSGVPAQEMLG